MHIVIVAVTYILNNINETTTKNLEKHPEGKMYKQSSWANRDASPKHLWKISIKFLLVFMESAFQAHSQGTFNHETKLV